MKKLGIVLAIIIGFIACKKEETVIVNGGQIVFYSGTVGLTTIPKSVVDTIGDTLRKVNSYIVKITKLQVSRDAVNWYTLIDSANAKWTDLIEGGDTLQLSSTLPIGVYQYAFITIDSTKISRNFCSSTFTEATSVSAVFTSERLSSSFGQKYFAYNDTSRIDTILVATSDSLFFTAHTTTGDTIFAKYDSVPAYSYTIDSLIHPNSTPPKVKHSMATDSLYWMLGGFGFTINRDAKTDLIIALHPETANRDLQSSGCGTGPIIPLFIGSQAEYMARDTVKAKY